MEEGCLLCNLMTSCKLKINLKYSKHKISKKSGDTAEHSVQAATSVFNEAIDEQQPPVHVWIIIRLHLSIASP